VKKWNRLLGLKLKMNKEQVEDREKLKRHGVETRTCQIKKKYRIKKINKSKLSLVILNKILHNPDGI
jgi:hypothetical protein